MPLNSRQVFWRVSVKVFADSGGVLIRAGRYNEPQTINKRLTLAATRGPVTIGN